MSTTASGDLITLRERFVMDVAYEIHGAMHRQGIDTPGLAKRLGRKPSDISKMISGHRPMSLRTLADIARALNCELELSFWPLDEP